MKEDLNLYECPEGCNNKDKDDHCMKCVEGSNFKPLIVICGNLIKRGSKSNPSYALPIDKKYIKDKTLNVKQKVKAVISQ